MPSINDSEDDLMAYGIEHLQWEDSPSQRMILRILVSVARSDATSGFMRQLSTSQADRDAAMFENEPDEPTTERKR